MEYCVGQGVITEWTFLGGVLKCELPNNQFGLQPFSLCDDAPKKVFRGGKWASLRDGPPTFMIEFSNFESVGSPVEVWKRMRRSKMEMRRASK